MLEGFLNDLRFAIRGLRKRPGFATAALLTLGLGLAANTTMFSMVNALLLRPLPLGERGERVVTLHGTHPTRAQDWEDSRVSFPDLEDVKREARSFEDVAGYLPRNLTVGGTAEAEAERIRGGSVTPNLFPMLGIAPVLGRAFQPEEAQAPGLESVALVSHAFWQRRFGGDPQVLGRELRLNGRGLTVVGVMPERFRFPHRDDVWVPFRPQEPRRDAREVQAFALLRDGASLAAAQHELDGVASRLSTAHAATNRDWGLKVLTFRDSMLGPTPRIISLVMLGAVGFVLLIGCANLANLFLARSVARRREMALRTSVGASRARLLGQMLTESLLVAGMGGCLGFYLSGVGLDLMLASWPEELPYWVRVEPDFRVFLFGVGMTLLTALAVGSVPALRASRADLVGDLRDGGQGGSEGPRTRRLQNALAVGQVAMCLALLVGASLMVRSFLKLQAAEAGFEEQHLLAVRLYMAGDRYDPVEAKVAFLKRASESLRVLPGVVEAAATTSIPTDDGGEPMRVVAEGAAVLPGEEMGVSAIGSTPGLLRALGVGLVTGRVLTDAESADPQAAVALANRALVSRFWPGQDPIGRRLGVVERGATTWFEVVGVVPDVQYEEFGEETPQSVLNLYLPYARFGWRSMALLVRTEGSPGLVAGDVRRALRGLDPGVPVWDLRTMREVRAFTTGEQRFCGELMGGFAGAALLLACIGVYGVLAYAVSRRTREIGVRLALGATRGDILRLVLKEGGALAAAGIGVGLLLSFGVARALRGVLYSVEAADPIALTATAAALGLVVLLESALPALRAARSEAMSALRHE